MMTIQYDTTDESEDTDSNSTNSNKSQQNTELHKKMTRTTEMNQMDNINKTTQTLPSDVRPASLTHESFQYVSAPNGPLLLLVLFKALLAL